MSFTKDDICKVDLIWQVGTIGFAANVFQCLLSQETPHDLADLDVVGDMVDWIDRILEPMEPHVVVSCESLGINVYKKVGDDYNFISGSPIAFTPGSIGDPLPSGVAALITAYTNLSKVLGKKYLPGLSETGQTAGLWIAGVLEAMADSAFEWVTHFASLADPYSEWYPGVWSTKAIGFRLFNGATMERDIPAYQRRRKAGVGT